MSAVAGASDSGLGTSGKRASCRYGQLCYRKNPDHWKQCSHPGDEDYDEPGGLCEDVTSTPVAASVPKSAVAQRAGLADRRPRCRYGRQCYRKNPTHLSQYSHPRDGGNGPALEDDDVEHAALAACSPCAGRRRRFPLRAASSTDATLEDSDF